MSQTTHTSPAASKPGVQALTTFGWKYIALCDDKALAERVAEEARDSGKYLKVRVN